MQTYTHADIHADIHAYIHMYIHIFIHTHAMCVGMYEYIFYITLQYRIRCVPFAAYSSMPPIACPPERGGGNMLLLLITLLWIIQNFGAQFAREQAPDTGRGGREVWGEAGHINIYNIASYNKYIYAMPLGWAGLRIRICVCVCVMLLLLFSVPPHIHTYAHIHIYTQNHKHRYSVQAFVYIYRSSYLYPRYWTILGYSTPTIKPRARTLPTISAFAARCN